MSVSGMNDEEVWMEAEHLVAENIGNARVRAFAREVLRQRQQLAGLTVELERQATEKRAWNIDANNLRADLAKAQARVAELESGCWCASLKVDGAEALAAVRLAQSYLSMVPDCDGRDSDLLDARAALDQAFGSGT